MLHEASRIVDELSSQISRKVWSYKLRFLWHTLTVLALLPGFAVRPVANSWAMTGGKWLSMLCS